MPYGPRPRRRDLARRGRDALVSDESLRRLVRHAQAGGVHAACQGREAVQALRPLPAYERQLLGGGRLRHRETGRSDERQHDPLRSRRLREPAQAALAVRRLHGEQSRRDHCRRHLRRRPQQEVRGSQGQGRAGRRRRQPAAAKRPARRHLCRFRRHGRGDRRGSAGAGQARRQAQHRDLSGSGRLGLGGVVQ